MQKKIRFEYLGNAIETHNELTEWAPLWHISTNRKQAWQYCIVAIITTTIHSSDPRHTLLVAWWHWVDGGGYDKHIIETPDILRFNDVADAEVPAIVT